MLRLVAGPVLGLESETTYTVCFVSNPAIQQASVQVGSTVIAAVRLANTPGGAVWRAEIDQPVPTNNSALTYHIALDGQAAESHLGDQSWTVHVPGAREKPRLAYASCNGFSDFKLMNACDKHHALWQRLLEQHQASPFSLLLMGGDQVYADSIWTTVPSIRAWNCLPLAEKVKRKASATMLDQLDRFYASLYCERWLAAPMAAALATIPSVMMWDDHDIIDGWGSFPAPLQQCEVYRAIYAAARKHFELFQLRGASRNKSRIVNSTSGHLSLGFRFRGMHVLAMDNRSERSIQNIMSADHWNDLVRFLDKTTEGDLLVMSAVPVVYRDFSFAEKAMDATPWEEELTDDLKDHWRAKEHQGERARLIMRLLANTRQRQGKTVILSGDVHVGCLGVIKDSTGGHPVNVHQLVSSGIVHPAPTAMQWAGVLATTNDRTETLDENGQIQVDMLKAFGAGTYFRTRNFITLQTGQDGKIWVNWECENGEKPVYPLG